MLTLLLQNRFYIQNMLYLFIFHNNFEGKFCVFCVFKVRGIMKRKLLYAATLLATTTFIFNVHAGEYTLTGRAEIRDNAHVAVIHIGETVYKGEQTVDFDLTGKSVTGLNWGATSSDQNATTIKDIQNLNIHLRSQGHDATNPNAIHQTVGIGGNVGNIDASKTTINLDIIQQNESNVPVVGILSGADKDNTHVSNLPNFKSTNSVEVKVKSTNMYIDAKEWATPESGIALLWYKAMLLSKMKLKRPSFQYH